MHVNPWVTLFAIDLPAVVGLLVFRPGELKLSHIVKPFELLKPLPSVPYFVSIFIIGIVALAVTAPVLSLNEPAKVTSSYEVLEPETWVGKELPILEYIDIGEQLKKGRWLILFYHYDCQDCAKAIPMYEQMARDLGRKEDFLKIAFVEVPPYGDGPVSDDSPCVAGRLADVKEWFVTTPAAVLVQDRNVRRFWQEDVPAFEELINGLVRAEKTFTHRQFSTIMERR